jgi:hypothetical protein
LDLRGWRANLPRAWQLALERGGDPDQPRGLKKVTTTW